jgi:beta-glucanase (GH16 family)
MTKNNLCIRPILIILLVVCYIKLQAQSKESETKNSKWQLVWSDEFNYNGLPDRTKWGYEAGFIRGSEPQYYQQATLKNSRVENGHLFIEAHKEKVGNAQYSPGEKDEKNWKTYRKSAPYTSASLITLNKASWKYGRFEMRARMPVSSGMWPAFWTMGINRTEVKWPFCGEIDILEYLASKPGFVTANVHYAIQGKHKDKYKEMNPGADLTNFHLYVMEWDEKAIRFYFNDINYHSVNISEITESEDNAFRRPHYILLNLALGGKAGGPVDESKLPQRMVVDYVRVYQKK